MPDSACPRSITVEGRLVSGAVFLGVFFFLESSFGLGRGIVFLVCVHRRTVTKRERLVGHIATHTRNDNDNDERTRRNTITHLSHLASDFSVYESPLSRSTTIQAENTFG